ncbi:MAG: aldehyde ferredoxin oxidoreductase N-terminal domain-containing protein, partial [Bacillota bacterium]
MPGGDKGVEASEGMGSDPLIARVDLGAGKVTYETLSGETLRECMGGTGLAAWYLVREVPPGADWDSPENRLLILSGVLGGTPLPGTGTFSVVSKGPMTGLAGSSQANGFLGAFLRSNGLLGVIVQGTAPEWVCLLVEHGRVRIADAHDLLGLDTFETERQLAGRTMGQVSVAAIGPAGENRVRFAAIVSDGGHVAAHNGLG